MKKHVNLKKNKQISDMKKVLLSLAFIIIADFIYSQNTVTGIDGNVYKTVKIGNQTWMAENLRATKYSNGDAIPFIEDSTKWTSLKSGAFCNYNNNEKFVSVYGRMYNWYAVTDSRNVCPSGWHVPSDEEWVVLENFLGGPSVAGGKMKLNDTTIWRFPNTGASNISGFSAVPGGRQYHSAFFFLHEYCQYWSVTVNFEEYCWSRYLSYCMQELSRFHYKKYYGLSVRCVKD